MNSSKISPQVQARIIPMPRHFPPFLLFKKRLNEIFHIREYICKKCVSCTLYSTVQTTRTRHGVGNDYADIKFDFILFEHCVSAKSLTILAQCQLSRWLCGNILTWSLTTHTLCHIVIDDGDMTMTSVFAKLLTSRTREFLKKLKYLVEKGK